MRNPLFEFASLHGAHDQKVKVAFERLISDESASEARGAVLEIIEAAKHGSSVAMCAAAELFLAEKYPRPSLEEALEFAKKASNIGFAPGQFIYAHFLEKGIGTAKDTNEAIRLLESAAGNGYVAATSHLAMIYSEGRIVPKDIHKAFQLNIEAAKAGDSVAAMFVAQSYEEGSGVQRNSTEALRWYEEALRLGNALAALRLSMAYSLGQLGLQPDAAKAERFSLMVTDAPIP